MELAIFDFLRSDDLKSLQYIFYKNKSSFVWPDITSSILCEHGSLKCLKFALENGCPIDTWATSFACAKGHLNILIYLTENNFADKSIFCCMYASCNNKLDCLQYCYYNNYALNSCIASSAATYGNYECLKFCLEKSFPIDQYTMINAAKSHHFDCLRLAHESKAPNCIYTFYRFVESINTVDENIYNIFLYMIINRFPICHETLFFIENKFFKLSKLFNYKNSIVVDWILTCNDNKYLQKHKTLSRWINTYIINLKKIILSTDVGLPLDIIDFVIFPYIN